MIPGEIMDTDSGMSDAQLAKMCLDKPRDRETVRAFVLRYSRIALQTVRWTFIRHGYANPGDAADVVQEIFVSLFDNNQKVLRSFDANKALFKTWFITVARNKSLNFIKKRHDVSLESPDDWPDEVSQSIDTHLEQKEQKSYLAQAVATFTDHDRLFYHLYFEEYMPPEICAQIMGIGVDTVYSQKAKIIEKIKNYITHHYHPGL
jgi:RNA polymerase sigma factor (sigma-70 family)